MNDVAEEVNFLGLWLRAQRLFSLREPSLEVGDPSPSDWVVKPPSFCELDIS